MSDTKKLRILRELFGAYNGNNNEYLFYCPKCEHHKRKLSINLEKNVFKCWVCDYSGRSINSIVRRYGNTTQYFDWRKLTNTIDILSFSDELFAVPEKAKEQIVVLPEEFISLANKNLPYGSLHAKNYLRQRGITKQDIVRWKIGYCTEGEYSERIIIPSFSLSGYCNYFIARSYTSNYRKYLNPTASRDIVFNHLFLDFQEDLSIVEGTFDAIVAGPNSAPLLGSTLREDSILFQEVIKNNTTVYMALDPDAEKKSMRLIKNLLDHSVEVYKIDIHPYSDVGEMTKDEYRKRKRNAAFINNDDYLLRIIDKI